MLLKIHPTPVMELSAQSPTATSTRLTPGGKPGPIQADHSTFHYYGLQRRTRIPWLALLVSVSLHAVGILGFNSRPAPKKVVVAKEEPSEILMMPNLDEEEDQKPRELSDDEAITPPSVQVPMLADIPTMIETSAFTQLVDLTPPPTLDAAVSNVMSIPVNIQRGRPDTSKIKDLFNLADLDRPPQPIVQTPPVFPYELKAQVSEASVRLGFIVTSQGDVIMPYVVNSTNRGFERPALEAVMKWKFKPGMRGGRKVNTRVEQPINFTVTTD